MLIVVIYKLDTQLYNAWINDKEKQSRERSRALSLHFVVVAFEKRAFGSPSTTVTNSTYSTLYIYIYIIYIYIYIYIYSKTGKYYYPSLYKCKINITILKWLTMLNCGRIFFLYYHFSLVISYHSGYLGAHIECRCLRSRGEDVTITDVIIKTPDKKWDWGCEWRPARKRWAGILGYFEKKAVSWDLDQLESSCLLWVCVHVGWVSELRADAGRTVSIVKIVCTLSSCWKPKSQEGNKSFNTWTKRVVSVSCVFRIPMHVNVLTHPYICIMYISRIRIMAILQLIPIYM